jgi:hypothetical protein
MSQGMPEWVEEFPGAITITGKDGTILYLNDGASQAFEKQGGRDALVGKNLDACHNEASRAIIRGLVDGDKANTYTITKNGVHKLIHQAPWYEGGELAGLVEISVEIPFDLPHFERG